MKVVNFFGAPGSGKSTAASGLFFEMKKKWINAELVTEFAKDLVWSGSSHLLSQQNLVFANQEHRLNRLTSQIDIAISDSPLLLSAFYVPQHYPASFSQSVFDFFNYYENINFFVNRSHEYCPMGRIQSEIESDSIARELKKFLHDNHIPFYEITAGDATPKWLMHWMFEQELLSSAHAQSIIDNETPPIDWVAPSLSAPLV